MHSKPHIMDTPTEDRLSVAPPATVTATQLGEHLGLARQRISALADDGVIERLPNARFDRDACRLRYLRWLRDPARRSARSEAAAKHAEAKTQLLHIKIEQKQRKLVRRDDVNELINQIAGTVLTHLLMVMPSGHRSSEPEPIVMKVRFAPEVAVRRSSAIELRHPSYW